MNTRNIVLTVVIAVLTTFAVLLMLGGVEDGAGTDDAAQPQGNGKGRFVVSHTQPEQDKHAELHQSLKDERILESFAEGLNEFLALPDDVTLTAAECGVVNAFYIPDERRIVLCYEFVEDIIAQAENSELDDAQQENYIAGTLMFILLHEVGHALTHVLELPVTGKEEDAVDQLAAILLIDDSASEAEFDENVEYVGHAASWFAELSEGDYDTEAFADEHSLGEQRYYNMMCWIYGAKPEVAQDIVEDGLLPAARAERCPDEYQQIARAWQKLLEPHLRS